LHLAVDSNTHEIICADLSLNNVTDSEAFPGLIRQTHRKIRQHRQTALTTPGSVTMNCGVRKSARLSRPEKVRVTGPVNMQTVTVQLLISG
jgi:predicted transcriptional regulator